MRPALTGPGLPGGRSGPVLTIDAALDGCAAALVVGGAVVASRTGEGGRGQAALLPLLARDVLAGTPAASLGLVAVVVGPGSFTGIRAALALGHGIGLAAGVPVAGVTVGAAFAAGMAVPAGWTLWTAIHARRGHVFLQSGGGAPTVERLGAVPGPAGPALVAGTAAADVVAGWTAAGHAAQPCGPAMADPAWIARAAAEAAVPPEPLYAEPPQVTMPGAPVRPGPST